MYLSPHHFLDAMYILSARPEVSKNSNSAKIHYHMNTSRDLVSDQVKLGLIHPPHFIIFSGNTLSFFFLRE